MEEEFEKEYFTPWLYEFPILRELTPWVLRLLVKLPRECWQKYVNAEYICMEFYHGYAILDIVCAVIESDGVQTGQFSCTLNIPETASATVALFNVRTTFYVLLATRNK